jgi:hypothetical protein
MALVRLKTVSQLLCNAPYSLLSMWSKLKPLFPGTAPRAPMPLRLHQGLSGAAVEAMNEGRRRAMRIAGEGTGTMGRQTDFVCRVGVLVSLPLVTSSGESVLFGEEPR